MRRIFRSDAVARFDVMMIEIKGNLEVIGDAIFEFFAEIENIVRFHVPFSHRAVTHCSNSQRPFGNKSVV